MVTAWWMRRVAPVYAQLASSYRVIALDQRGHGRGMRSTEPFSLEDCADDAAALLDQLGVRDVIAVGYSMGGPVALLLARRHPGRVKALALQDRLVRPARQRELAGALRARVIEVAADHDLPLAQAAEYGRLTRQAADMVAA